MPARWVGYAAIAIAAAAAATAGTLLVTDRPSSSAAGLLRGSTSVSSPGAGSAGQAGEGAASCAPAVGIPPAWPAIGLDELPRVAGAEISSVQRQDGTLAIQFGVPASFLTVTAQLRTELPAEGFALFGGDQEAREADVRFISGTLTGGFKLVDVGGCYMRGILAVVDPAAGRASPTPMGRPPGSPSR